MTEQATVDHKLSPRMLEALCVMPVRVVEGGSLPPDAPTGATITSLERRGLITFVADRWMRTSAGDAAVERTGMHAAILAAPPEQLRQALDSLVSMSPARHVEAVARELGHHNLGAAGLLLRNCLRERLNIREQTWTGG